MADQLTQVLGIVAMSNKGEYNPQTNYEKLNVVTYNGSSYCAKQNCKGKLPTDQDYWQLLAEKGETGATGPQGPLPVKGVDYYTSEDRAEFSTEISQDVHNEVSEQVGNLVSATPIAVNSVSEMTNTSRIYVNVSDGKWYYYNGSNWTPGGIYQETAIDYDNTFSVADKPVESLIIGKNLNGLLNVYETFDYDKETNGSLQIHINLNRFEVLRLTNTNADPTCKSTISLRKGVSNLDGDMILDTYTGDYSILVYLPIPFYRIQFWSDKPNSHLKIEKVKLNFNELTNEFLKDTILSYNIKENIFNYKETASQQKQFTSLLSVKKGELLYIKGKNIEDNMSILFQQNINDNYTTISRIYSNITGEGIDTYFYADNDYDRIYVTFYNSNNTSTEYSLTIDKYKTKRGKTIACFGDSITSDQVSGIGTLVGNKIGANIINNFAVGYATCTDWHIGETNTTTINLEEPANAKTNDNVLSNQVRRCLQRTTPLGQQIVWNYFNNSYSIDTSYGTGLGHTDEIPDIIYIAIGINDGDDAQTPYNTDDLDEVLGQNYTQLTRNSMASALKWAIETLRLAYPNAQIFVATPLQTQRTSGHTGTTAYMYKRDVIKAICESESCSLIDTTVKSGVSKYVIQKNNRSGETSNDLHPNSALSYKIADFVANEIKNQYFI